MRNYSHNHSVEYRQSYQDCNFINFIHFINEINIFFIFLSHGILFIIIFGVVLT